MFNVPSIKDVSIDEINNQKVLIGYRAAATVDVNLLDFIYVNSGLSFVQRGSAYKDGESNKIRNKMHYLQIPVNVGFKFMLSPNVGAAIQAGPYFGMALAGKSTKTGIEGAKETFDIFKEGVAGLKNSEASRFDVGLGAQAILSLGSIYGAIGADFGLLNTLKGQIGSGSGLGQNIEGVVRNTAFHVGLGVSF